MAHVRSAKTPTAALQAISETNFKAIILADEALAAYPNRENKQVRAKIKTYVENGGLAIVGLHFTSFTRMDSFNRFFKAFGLPWVRGDYHRTTFELVSSAELPGGTVRSALPEPYSMKALHVKDARVQERMYIAAEVDSMTENRIFAPEYVDRTQAAVAAANLGQGYLVYCGSVNSERESSRLILALCGFKVESD